MLRRTRELCLLAVWIAGAAWAQVAAPIDPAAPNVNLGDGLSAREAVALALARNPELLALRKGQAVAQAYVSQARTLPNPELRFSVSDIDSDPDGEGLVKNTVGIRWSPPRPGELALKSRIEQSRVDEVAGSIGVAEQRLAADVRLLHQTISLIDEQIRIADETVRIRQEILAVVQAQLKAGVKSLLELNVVEISLAEAHAVADRYRLERRLQFARLAARLDLPRNYQVPLQSEGDPLAFRPPQIERERMVASALEHRMEVKSAGARCARAELGVKAANRERYPWLSFAQVSRRAAVGEDPASWGFQWGVDLPLFNWRGGGELQAGTAELAQCRLQQQAVKAGIAAEIDELRLRLELAAKELEAQAQAMGPEAQRNLERARAALAEGQADATEPLLAQARQLTARLAYVTKLMDVRALEIALEQAAGISGS
jgi:cobalt-zinc-cadmium efflux system outer membrane protein